MSSISALWRLAIDDRCRPEDLESGTPGTLATVMVDIGMADEQEKIGAPLVSVVMPVLNGMPWIEHQLKALAAQQLAVDWEVVVADNGSDDGTRSCVMQWSERYSRIHLVDASARPGKLQLRMSGSGQLAAASWRSVTPTTSCAQAGSLLCWRPSPTPIWSRGYSTSPSWTEIGNRFRSPQRHGSWGSSLSAWAPTWPSGGKSSRPCRASPRNYRPKTTSICAGDFNWRATGSPSALMRSWKSASAPASSRCSGLPWVMDGAGRGFTGGTALMACGAIYVVRPKLGSGWLSPVLGWFSRRDAVSGCARSAFAAGRLAGSVHLRVFFP